MSDEHDPDSQSMHEDASDHEHPVQAPVDDFSDAGSAAEEMPTVSQEAATESDESASAGSEGRSRSMFPLFIGIIGILVVGGGLAYWQFGRSSGADVATLEQTMAAKTASPAVKLDARPTAPETPAVAAKSPDTAPASAANSSPGDINTLYKPAADKGTEPASVPTVAALPSSADSGNAASIGTSPSAQAGPPPMEPPTIAPQNSAIPATSVVPATTGASAIPAAGATTPGAVQSRIDTLASRIDELQESLNQANKQLSQVTAAQTAIATSSQANPAIEDRLNKIEQNLTQLEHQEVTAKPEVKPGHNGGKKASSQTKTMAAHKHESSRKVTTTHRRPSKPQPEKVMVSSSWVLRAATPNEAWISGNATSADLRHIKVGDSLPGIGKVKAISQSSNGWEIEGSEAIVR